MTTTNNDLQTKIEKLTKEHNFKNEIAEKLPTVDTLAFLSGRNNDEKRLVARCKDVGEFKNVLELYPATNEKQTVSTAGQKNYAEINCPFRLDIDNPCRTGQFQRHLLKISYISNDIDISCELPIECISEFVKTGERGITDSEYHYFTGFSLKSIQEMRVRTYLFNSPSQVSWYGGNKTLTDTNETTAIIDHLLA